MTIEPDGRRICCLPVAGPENPYQTLMMDGLRRAGHRVNHGADGRWLAVLRSVLRDRPEYLHFDWIEGYYLHRSRFLTWLHALLFVAEVALARRLVGLRVVWTLHNLTPHDRETGAIRFVQRRFARQCAWVRVFQRSSLSRATRALELDAGRMIALPEGSYAGYYPAGASREEGRTRMGLAGDAFVLLHLGNIRPYKGVEDLLDAFELVADEEWVLLIAGPAHDTEYVTRLLERAGRIPGVRLSPGFVAEEDLQYHFAASDVVVTPFRRIENSGSVILAMSFAKPVVAPCDGVLPERLRAQPELLYSENDLPGTLRRARELGRERLEKIGERNLMEVERHTWEAFGALFNETPMEGR